MVVVDTSVIIDHLRMQGSEDSKLEKVKKRYGGENLAVSIISVQELYAGKSTKETQKEQEVMNVLGILRILPYDFEAAKKSGIIIRDNGWSMSFADAAIAATAIVNGAELATINRKDFEGIEGLELTAKYFEGYRNKKNMR